METLKSLKIGPKILARRSNEPWDILLATEEKAKMLAGSTLAIKSVSLQTEYKGARRTNITGHRVLVDISGTRLGAFFAKYSQVDEVTGTISKAGIATGNFVL